MKCWSCGVQSAHCVEGPPGLAVCEGCILRSHVETGTDFSGACTFCAQNMGVARGWLRRRPPLRVGLRHGDQVMCHECLQLMRDIVAERDEAEQ